MIIVPQIIFEMDVKRLYDAFLASRGVNTDSRTVVEGEMFFALKGDNFDGNEYALASLEKGASCAVVTCGSAAAASGDPRVIAVPDTLEALQALARHHRENTFVDGKRITVIGLTGTNGKTTTKELITRVLSVKYNVTATSGNLNNDIGVPLSLLKIGPETQLAVIEMGANHPDDIGKLVKVSEPDYGLITNVGKAHLLGFGSFEGVKKAKGMLYDYISEHSGTIFINADDQVLCGMAAGRPGMKAVEYGINFWDAMVLPCDADHPYVRMAIPEKVGGIAEPSDDETLLALETHLSGAYNANNAAAAIAVGLHFGVSLQEAMDAISEYVPVNNRSQLEKTGTNVLIKDAYNANPTSMAAALDNLCSIISDTKVALLGDMRELGEESVSEHVQVLRQVLSMGLDLVCLVGEEFGKAVEADNAGGKVKCFGTSEELASWLDGNPVRNATVLVKGSRGIRMETVIPHLQS